MRRGVDSHASRTPDFDGLLKIALAEAEARAGDPGRALAILDEALATATSGLSRVRSRTASGARRNPVQARPRQSRARGRRLPDRHRHCEAARHAQLRTARGAVARETLSIDRPSRRRPRFLAPALEGFAPTPEIPEITEAQEMLAAIEAGPYL